MQRQVESVLLLIALTLATVVGCQGRTSQPGPDGPNPPSEKDKDSDPNADSGKPTGLPPVEGGTGHTDRVFCVSFSPDGKTVASGGFDAAIKVWDVQTGKVRYTLKGHEHDVRSVAFSPDGKTLASCSYDRTIKLWDTKTWMVRATLKGHTDCVDSLSFSPDGKTLASGSNDNTIKLWDTNT
jgi:WD40 repeat protein